MLANQAFTAALETLEKDVIEAWSACPARDLEGKEYYWQLYKNTQRLRGILVGYLEGGKHAKAQMQPQKGGVAQFFKKTAQAVKG